MMRVHDTRRSIAALIFTLGALGCTGSPIVGGIQDATIDTSQKSEAGADAKPDAASDGSTPDGTTPDVQPVDVGMDAPMTDGPAGDAMDDVAGDAPADVPVDTGCRANAQCTDMMFPVCDVATGRCVQCLPAMDTCPMGQYCDPMSNVCSPGCRDDAACGMADGGMPRRCDLMRRQCVECAADVDCPLGRVCTMNACVPGCNAMRACPTGEMCCSGACANTGSNVANCGACGTRCEVANGVAACNSGACAIGMCSEGFADCNMRAMDGCEVNTADDAMNCGRCGMACPVPANASAAQCNNGRCIFTCNTGFADCNDNAMDGCEVNLTTSAQHCGMCRNACPARPGASAPACAMGRCDVTCEAGRGNCDGMQDNGCERDVTGDVNNCGRCGEVCPVRANATPTCAMGRCGVACNAGFADCDNDPSNGCEVNLTTSAAHCGRCGNMCATPANAGMPSCADSQCRFTCSANFADCDGMAANGCEVDTRTATAHCGGCGRACATRPNTVTTCGAGTCEYACAAGFADCDMNTANGCETDIRTSLTNCGRCGMTCTAPGGTPACVAGTCGIATCGGNFADCDMNAGNGCETDTRTSAQHCARCGNACPVRPNSVPACVAGGCLNTCSSGFGECDGNLANGCETNLATSTAHCGGCGRACAPANATAMCAASACAIAACNAGFANCNGAVGDGCEVNTTNTVAHCGRCGNACSVANGTPGCAAGACTVAACNAGFGNCNNNVGDGCEVNLTNTVAHCGACGRSCALPNATPVCGAGACAIGACNANFADCDRNPANGCEVNLTTDVNNCGACGARPEEVCDGRDNNCNGRVDEGCPVSLSGLANIDFNSGTYGGGGGGPFSQLCPSGQVVRGIFGRSGSLLDQIGVICGTATISEDRSVTPFRYTVVLTGENNVGPNGGGGGGAFRYRCPGNSMVGRTFGRAGSLVDQVRVECFNWDLVRGAGNVWRVARSGSQGTSGVYGGGGGGPWDYVCPNNGSGVPSHVRQFFGRSGGLVDQLRIGCTWPILNTR